MNDILMKAKKINVLNQLQAMEMIRLSLINAITAFFPDSLKIKLLIFMNGRFQKKNQN